MTPVEAREIRIAGRQLRCHMCDYTRFIEREAQLQSAAGMLFGQDWASSKATCMVCEQCGYVHWFLASRQSALHADDSTLAQEIESLRQRIEAEDLEPLNR